MLGTVPLSADTEQNAVLQVRSIPNRACLPEP
jgi:hypothetical protein